MRLAISTTETLTDLKTDLVVANNNNNRSGEVESLYLRSSRALSSFPISLLEQASPEGMWCDAA